MLHHPETHNRRIWHPKTCQPTFNPIGDRSISPHSSQQMTVHPISEDNQINPELYYPKLPIYNPDDIPQPSFDEEGFKQHLKSQRW